MVREILAGEGKSDCPFTLGAGPTAVKPHGSWASARRRAQLDNVPVGVGDEDLQIAVRPRLGTAQHRHACRLQEVTIFVTSSRAMPGDGCGWCVFRPEASASGAGAFVFEDDVNLRRPGLEPQAGEREGWPRHFAHAQHFDVKPTRPCQLLDHQCGMIEGVDAQ